jgi:hypothetical protein
MFLTRRRFGYMIACAAGASGLSSPAPAKAQAAEDDGLPNVFISPSGKPFRAPPGAPYPVVDWFHQADRNGDSRLDRSEFLADAEAFFKVLDVNGDGVLDPYEVSIYEHRIAPEILGPHGNAAAQGHLFQALDRGAGRLWRIQSGPFGGEFPAPGSDMGPRGGIDPGGEQPNAPSRRRPEEDLGEGASPYGLLRAPEPVTAGDPEFMFRGIVRKANFISLADRNFSTLDSAGEGYLTLEGLPKTPLQRLIETARHGRRSRKP